MTEGLKQTGFTVVAAVDNDPVCCQTYALNHPEVRLFQEDIQRTSANGIKSLLNGKRLDLLVVCAPCQPFSKLNKSEKPDDRVYLILQAIRFARSLKPNYIFFENVPGIVKNSCILVTLTEKLDKLGYILSQPYQIDAADFEVPQRRLRCILVASKKTVPAFISPKPITPTGRRVTVRSAISYLPSAPLKTNPEDSLHFCRKHDDQTIRRLQNISHDGGSRNELPADLVLPCHKKLDDSGDSTQYCDVYGRMKWDSVAPTLTTGCTDVTKGRYAHPVYNRAITLREAALLQTFPPKYKFSGNSGQIARQIGNAVPVNLIKHISSELIHRREA